MKKEKVLIVNFKGQYSRIIARRVRELKVYCEIVNVSDAYVKALTTQPAAIIFSGGPDSVFEKDSLRVDRKIFDLNIPILGICYGAQLIAYEFGGVVKPAKVCEYGVTEIELQKNESEIFSNVAHKFKGLMSHKDYVELLPKEFEITAKTKNLNIAAFENVFKKIYAVQFHPEVVDTQEGEKILKNFLFNVAACEKNWDLESFLTEKIDEIRGKVQDKKVLLALSGGVDSSVLAAVLKKAIGANLTAVFVDHGLLRKGEKEQIIDYFSRWDINFICVDAKDLFLEKLKDVVDPEEKRKIIGSTFIEVFEKESKKIGGFKVLAQGTIYPDIIESGDDQNSNNTIKSHHNVGGLPKNIDFEFVLEPLKFLFKDEVRKIGESLKLPDFLIKRQPFPGPGLAIRIIGPITKKKIKILQEADYIFRREVERLKERPSQYFAVLLNTKSVGVMGDSRSYCFSLALRAVKTDDFMTARVFLMPLEDLERIAQQIVNNVDGINRVLYDVTGKPPATIEFE